VLSLLQHWPANLPLLQEVAQLAGSNEDRVLSSACMSADTLTCGPPVDLPRQVYCSGANYRKHVIDLIVAQDTDETRLMSKEERARHGALKMDERAARGTPFFFLKPASSITGPCDDVVLPREHLQPDWELELGVVIGKSARRVGRESALDYVAGYTIVNDITARDRLYRRSGDLKELGLDWVAGKCAPTFLPMGPYLVPAAFIADPQQLQVVLRLNGRKMQDESTADMIFGVARLIEALSAHCVLQPGDLICTGSPAGNGMHYGRFLRSGDVMEGSISGLGMQRNTCTSDG
jgi:2-keto-4-pentenoate hydratase/2-oxohepta-3-ene-1,7-dioic acid hydratase in catechol pathway